MTTKATQKDGLGFMMVFGCSNVVFIQETFMTTMATQKDGLGFMMVFGSLAWVPFYFSLPVRYLLMNHARENNYYMLTAVCLIQGTANSFDDILHVYIV